MTAAPPRSVRTLKSYVATFGNTIALIRAKDDADARRRIRARLAYLHQGRRVAIDDDEILVRPATTDDRHLLDVCTAGSTLDRAAWAQHLIPA